MDNLLELENKVNFKYSLEEKKCEKVRKGSKKSEVSRTLKGGGGDDRVQTEGGNSRWKEEAGTAGRQCRELEKKIWAPKFISEEPLYSLVVKSSASPFP